jgi:hypothetical protein
MEYRARQRHFIAVAAATILSVLQPATAQFRYVTNSGAITITGYTGSGPAIIPGTLNGYPVTTIGNTAFEGDSSLTGVTIPNSATNIGAYAFAESGLNGVTIPNSVIGIGQNAFAACISLTNISVNAGNPAYSSLNGVLFDQAQGTLIQYPGALTNSNYAVPGSVASISDFAFYGVSSVGRVTIPHSVTSIGNEAFAFCSALNTLYFKGNAPNVGSSAFYETGSGKGVTVNYLPGTTGWQAFSAGSVAASMPWYLPAPEVLNFEPNFGVYNNQFGFTISWATNATVMVDACTNLLNPLWVPVSTNSVIATIGATNFTDPQWGSFPTRFYRLRSGSVSTPFSYDVNSGAISITGYSGSNPLVTIPAAINGYPVVSIGNEAFEGDTSVTGITIPNSVTDIGAFAFAGSGLTAITIPNSVAEIDQNAFASCSSLTNITVTAGNPAYSSLNGVLFDSAQDVLIQYPPASASYNYTVPGTVTSIGDDAFYGATSIGSVTMPNSVSSIGDDAFAFCVALNAVYFAGNAPNVGSFSFYDTGFGGGITVNYRPGTAGWPAFDANLAALGQSIAASTFWYWPTPEALNFEPTFGVQNNQFGFTISWATNATIVVDACTNFANPVWLPISTNTLTATNGSAYFSDPRSGGYRSRFYRLRSQ